jgi:arginase
MKAIKLIEVKSEIGAGTRGASLGIGAMKTAAHNKGSDFFKRFPMERVPTYNDLLYAPIDTPHAIRVEGIARLYKLICESMLSVINEGKFPIVLGGDHSCAGGTLTGLRMAYPKDRIGVIWIDAHADLHSPYSTPSGNVHGMPLGAALDLDHRDVERNEIKGITLESWEKMKNGCTPAPWIQPEDIVLMGVRDTEPEEKFFIKQLNIKTYTVEDCQETGFTQMAERVLRELSHCDRIYVSFDVDSLDSIKVSDGTGTPSPNGFLTDEVQEMVSVFAADPRLCCFEVVEINPTLDSRKNKMAEAALEVLEQVVETIDKKEGLVE